MVCVLRRWGVLMQSVFPIFICQLWWSLFGGLMVFGWGHRSGKNCSTASRSSYLSPLWTRSTEGKKTFLLISVQARDACQCSISMGPNEERSQLLGFRQCLDDWAVFICRNHFYHLYCALLSITYSSTLAFPFPGTTWVIRGENTPEKALILRRPLLESVTALPPES